jgi:hypothetical protein
LAVVEEVFGIDKKPAAKYYQLPNGNTLQPIGEIIGREIARNPEVRTLWMQSAGGEQRKLLTPPAEAGDPALEAIIERVVERTVHRLGLAPASSSGKPKLTSDELQPEGAAKGAKGRVG